MKKITITLLMITLFSATIKAQNNFKKLWTEVEQLEVEGLPKSALKIVDDIYAKADKENNASQIIKALFYKSKFSLTLEEDAQLKVINNFKKHINKTSFPAKNVLQNVLANLYWDYFKNNRYKFYNRTKTSKKVDANDFRTWDLNTLFKETHLYFEASLQNSNKLQKVKIEEFSDILQIKKESKIYSPTLFDFLANNALQFYKSSETSITRPSYKFSVDNTSFLGDAKTFSKLKITSKDSLSLQLNALKVYQKLIDFHYKKNNLNALAFIDIERLNFVNQHATFDKKEVILLQSLKSSEKKLKKQKASGLYAFEIAEIYKNNSKNKDAVTICKKVIKQFPKSLGAQKCAILKAKIEEKSLSIKAEEFIPINKNSRLLITYKNVEKLFFSAYKINPKQKIAFQKLYKFEDKKAFINNLEKVKTWTSKLRNEHDYLQHTTEVIVPKFDNGNYLVLASENEDLEEKHIYGTTNIQATNLVLVENNFDGKYNYQIVDRNSGKPIKNAEIHLKNKSKHEDHYINKKLTTDKNGFASFKSKNYYSNVFITVKTKNDVAAFGQSYLYEHYNRRQKTTKENIVIKPFIFTDRSIYRPGQTVYFKAIVIKKQGEKSEVFTNEYVEIILKDVNNQEVKTLDLKLNEFGSVAGEFVLPNNGLTGNFTIAVDEGGYEVKSDFYDNKDFDFDYNNFTKISVEEYKRPKFETEFKPIKESYKINDSVTVNGFAKAFSGANITDAKVVYRVHRKVQYPNWYYWYRPQNPTATAQEITHGESTTDASGNFSIKFKALADETVDKKNLPIFSYEITADVTDVNGETRSATTVVKVGYHALIATVSLDDKIDKTQKETLLKIDTKNLNDEFVAAKGTLKIYKLQAPKTVQRKRPWSVPDFQDISENTFRVLFPNEAFTEDETDEKKWKKGTLVFSKNFDTKTSKEITLNNIKNWKSGKYIVVLESKDKFNQKVKDEKRFTLFSSKEKTVADNKLLSINFNKTTFVVGDEFELQIGSAAKNATVILQIEKNYTIVDTKIIKLNDCVKTIKFPITEKEKGGFAIKYHFVKYNYFESGNFNFDVKEPQKNIEIITNIFRDKLQPGQNEMWSFTIKDDKNDAVAAEILASMYDASLDEFKSHNWQFNPITPKPNYYSYNVSKANKSFKNTNFYIRNIQRNYYSYPTIDNSNYNWFGFSFNNNRWSNQQYLRFIKKKINNTRKDFDGTITGIVTEESGVLPGVSVAIKGTTFGTETDFDGYYSLKVKKGDVLVFSYLGYETQEIKIQNEANVDVFLEPNDEVLDEVVVTAFGIKRRTAEITVSEQVVRAKEMKKVGSKNLATALTGRVSGLNSTGTTITLRGMRSFSKDNNPLFIIDGIPSTQEKFQTLNPDEIKDVYVFKDKQAALALYGASAKNGVVIIKTKKGQAKLEKELSKVQARKNFKETAFFFPQLKTDKNGKVSFNFTMPEALTKWKLQLLAHTKDLKSATKTMHTITQKELMVVPNAPRFLREKDTITLSAKITNLTNNQLNGFTKLILTDAISGKEINTDLQNTISTKNFTVDKDGNTNVSWQLAIPETVKAVQYKIVAKAGDFSDGEQNVLPVLTNRKLVTETMPMFVRSNQTKTFTLDKLRNNSSSTLKNHQLTLEMTSNPVWYAVQSLPYLMEYPYECAEQTFSRYYANTLASFVANSNPKIQKVFNAWKSSEALISNLEKNQELKSMIIQETPWLRDAQSETEQKKRIAMLFDLTKMKNMQEKAINKLKDIQMNSGGFPWFKGSKYASTFITQHIAAGFGHLQKLGVSNVDVATKRMIVKAVKFLDEELIKTYDNLLENAEKYSYNSKSKKKTEQNYKAYLAKNNLSYATIQYLYMRSFYDDISLGSKTQEAVEYYKNQSQKYWTEYNLYAKGQIALTLFRDDNKTVANKILKSLKENAIISDELGMYWKSNTAGYWYYQAPIETQALLIETFSEIENDEKTIDNLKIWLLKNKQTNKWKTTKATTEAVYALLLNGSDWIAVDKQVDVTIGGQKIDAKKLEDVKIEAGTGYYKTSWKESKISNKMSKVTISKKEKGIAWGALYWQYFEDLDKITSAETPLKLKKKLFLKVNSDTGKELKEINKNTQLKVGDLITVRIELKSDRDMEFIHMKDMRASGVEPINVLSKYKWQDNLGYYQSTKDAATNFFFDSLPKGVYVFEYDVRVNNAGNFSNGITTIQSMYAPEFSSHSEGVRLRIEK